MHTYKCIAICQNLSVKYLGFGSLEFLNVQLLFTYRGDYKVAKMIGQKPFCLLTWSDILYSELRDNICSQARRKNTSSSAIIFTASPSKWILGQ